MEKHPLGEEIRKEHLRLVQLIEMLPGGLRDAKAFEGTGRKVSASEIIAYQIGWGKALIRWYEDGIQGKGPEMPGDGFLSWDYVGLASHFYQNYLYDRGKRQMEEFSCIVEKIVLIVEKEHSNGNLDRTGVWSWCTLKSGKLWPLSKWIRVNTASPCRRAYKAISAIRNG